MSGLRTRFAHEPIFPLGVLVGILISTSLMAGIRGPGKYSGVVFYDRWDNCVLFDGVYLMYISEAAKETLRPYQGQSVEINASDVYQPVNPGDGLIRRFILLGRSVDKAGAMPVSAIALSATPSFGEQGALTLLIDIRNDGHFPINISANRLGFAVFARRHNNEDFIFNPSDGPSYAVITRASAANSTGKSEVSVGENVRRYAWRVNPDDRLANDFTLQIGQSRRTSVAFHLPQGSYQFLAGYGQDVLSGQCVASNSVAFDVDQTGNATAQ